MNNLQSTRLCQSFGGQAINKTAIAFFIGLSLLFVVMVPVLANAATTIIPCATDATNQKPCTFADLVTMGNRIIDFLIYDLAAPFAVLLFMWAGWLFMFHSSNSGEISRAKGIFFNVVVGFILALVAFIIIKLILAGLGVAVPSELKL